VLDRIVTQRDATIADLTDEIVRRDEWASRLDVERAQTRADLDAITDSHSWRWTHPLREVRRWISMPRQQARRFISGGFRAAKQPRSR